MKIVKALYPSLLHRVFNFQGKPNFCASLLWGFDLSTGEPMLEKDLWIAIGDMLGKNQLFDAGMPKPRGEVLVHGSFHSPAGEPVTAGKISFQLGSVRKELAVFGNRHWVKGLGVGLGVSEPEPMTTMPIDYAHAYGGEGFGINPTGKGFRPIETEFGPVHELPNVEYLGQLIGSPADRPSPAAYNRMDQMWDERAARAGTYDQKYLDERMPGLPDDVDWTYFNDGAKDQWIDGFFNGDESYEIVNMHPNHSKISGRLPNIQGRCFIRQLTADGESQFHEIKTRLDTVWLFPSANLGVLIHRGTVAVAKEDGSDIVEIMMAHEAAKDAPRSEAHYADQLAKRTDTEKGAFYMLNTAAIIPDGYPSELSKLSEGSEESASMLADNIDAFVNHKVDNAMQQVEEKKLEAAEKMREFGQDPTEMLKQFDTKNQPPSEEEKKIRELMEQAIPGIMDDPKNIDFSKMDLSKMDAIQQYMDEVVASKTDEAKRQLLEQKEKVLALAGENAEMTQAADAIDQALSSFDALPKLPRIEIDESIDATKAQLESAKQQAHVLMASGVPEEDVAAMLNIDLEQTEASIRDAVKEAVNGYRIGAHFMGKATSPHPGKEPEIKQALLEAYANGNSTAGTDAAFVDLSGEDLTGINLSGAFLEYADLSHANLTGANLENAILAHANLTGSCLDGANLKGANLGAATIHETKCDQADLTEATFGRADMKNCHFTRCVMVERADMFMETTFDHADFSESQITGANLLELDLANCKFEKANLAGSNIINTKFDHASFAGANLEGVNFVTCEGENADFSSAMMTNCRFVAGCKLPGAKFISATADACNFRDNDLSSAIFDSAVISQSDFSNSLLSKSSFTRSIAIRAQFSKADLNYAKLDQVNLMEGSLQDALLSEASFVGANLYGVNFFGCTVGSTDFALANLDQTLFKHWKPS